MYIQFLRLLNPRLFEKYGWLTVAGIHPFKGFILQQRKLGVFSHSTSFGAGRSSKNPDSQSSQVPGFEARFPSKVPKQGPQRFPRTGFQAGFPANTFPGNRFPGNRFPSKVPRNRFLKVPKQGSQGSQARVPGTGFHRFFKEVPRNRFSQIFKEVPKQGSQETGPQARFPRKVSKQGSKNRFPSKVTKNRFPGTGSQEQVPRNR